MEQESGSHRILIVEHDQAISELLEGLFLLEGYRVQIASSLEAAHSWLVEQSVDLVLTDSFLHRSVQTLESLEALRRQAYPIPVGVLTGWKMPPEEAKARGFAFLIVKPFDLDSLLVSVAAALSSVWTAERQTQAAVVERFFAMLNARAWEDVPSLCSEQVRHYTPTFLMNDGLVQGVEAFRAHMEDGFSLYPNSRYDEVRCYPTPEGIAARYFWHWDWPDEPTHHLTGGKMFYFANGRIAQIGNEIDARQMSLLLEQRFPARAS
jgi:CheY-like chemotaxis protein